MKKTLFRSFVSNFLLFCALCFYWVSKAATDSKLYRKGDEYLLYSKFDSALICFEQVKIESQKKGDDFLHVAALNKISETYAAFYNPSLAEEYAQMALKLSDEKFGTNSIQHLIALNNLGNANYLRGKHQLALEAFKKVIAQYEKLSEEQKIMLASPVIMGMGNVYFSKYQYKDALNYFQQALEINTKYFGAHHPNVASSLMSLGNLHRNMGSYSNAQEYYEKASKMLISYFGEAHPSVAASYVGKADLYTSQRQFDLATRYYLLAMSIYEQFLKPGDPRFGDVYLGLGDVAKGERNYEESIKQYQKALSIFENSVGLEHQNTVKANLEIGNSYMYQEEILKALDYYNKVLEINYMLVGEYHTNTSGAYNNLGGVYYFIGNYKLALSYYERALKIDKAIYGNDHPNVANSYYNIAKVYSEKGDSEKALEYIQLAINASIIDFENDDIYVSPALLNYFDDKDLMWYLNFKGETLEAGFRRSANIKGLDVALKSFVKSDSLIDRIRESYTNKQDQAELSKLTTKIYASAVNSAFSLIQLLTPQNVKYIDRDAKYDEKLREYKEVLFYFSEKSKASVLFSSVAKANAKKFGGVPDSLLKKETHLKTSINQYTQELNLTTDAETKKRIANLLSKTNTEYENLLARFKNEFPKYHDLKYDVSVVNVKQLQKFIGDSTLLISYAITKDNLFILTLTKHTIEVYKQKLDEHLEKKIRALRNGIIKRVDYVYTKHASLLFNYLFPFSIAKNIKHIVVVPDGPIHFIPFEILLTSEVQENTVDFKDLPYMINQYSFSYTYSANLWYKKFNNTKILSEKAPKELLAVAPIDFEYTYGAEIVRYPSLPGTKEEVENIKLAFNKNNKTTQTLMEQDAHEHNVKSINLSDFKYVHLASHGFMNPDNPEKSGILLRQTPNSQQDGIMYSGEIYDLVLNAELTLVSACESGLGKVANGEGLIGLGRSLLYAGAKSLVLSLWTVSDEATNRLMSDFYENVAKLNVPKSKEGFIPYAEHLRTSKLRLISSDNFSEPYFWAPFILQGR